MKVHRPEKLNKLHAHETEKSTLRHILIKELKPVSRKVLQASREKKTHKCKGTKIKCNSGSFTGSNTIKKTEQHHYILERRKSVQLELKHNGKIKTSLDITNLKEFMTSGLYCEKS